MGIIVEDNKRTAAMQECGERGTAEATMGGEKDSKLLGM